MDPANFKKLIIIWWILVAILLPVSVVSQRYLPDELLVYIDRIANKQPELFDWIILGIGLGMLIAVIIASIGLYRLRHWGRKLFLWTHILSLAVSPALGPSVMSEWTATVCYLNLIVSGGIIFLSYTSPTSLSFD